MPDEIMATDTRRKIRQILNSSSQPMRRSQIISRLKDLGITVKDQWVRKLLKDMGIQGKPVTSRPEGARGRPPLEYAIRSDNK